MKKAICTGFGQHYTHGKEIDGKPNKAKHAGTPYPTISVDDVWAMVANPQAVAKENAQWIIPSSYHDFDARAFAAQHVKGVYDSFLCWDIDKGNYTKEQVLAAVRATVPGAAFAMYSSRSAQPGKFKWHILIPIDFVVTGKGYNIFQTVLLEELERNGVEPDYNLARTAQLFYLPNRGEYYEYHYEAGSLFTMENHPTYERAVSLYHMVADSNRSQQAVDRHSFIAAFNEAHSTESLFRMYGFETKNGINWKSPDSESGSFGGTKLFEDGINWFSSANSMYGIGKPASGGGSYGDAFDLYTHFNCGGNRQLAEQYAKKLLRKKIWGEATPEHGFEVWNGLSVQGTPVGQKAQEDALAKAVAAAEEAAKANEKLKKEYVRKEITKWSGDWQKEVPFPIEATVWEWLAWNMPGVIGHIVRHEAKQASRQTLVPLLAGALLSVGYMSQGKFVLRNSKFATPAGLGIQLVGGTGSSKGDAPMVFSNVRALLNNRDSYPNPIRKFKSGAAVSKYFGINPDRLLIHNEGGADRKASLGDKHYEAMIGDLTDAMTGFMQGLYESAGANEETTAKACADPSLMALLAGTPGKTLSSYSHADAESGYLGRWVIIPVPERRRYLDALDTMPTNSYIKTWVDKVESTIPPLHVDENVYVHNVSNRRFFILRFSDEADEYVRNLTEEFDIMSGDLRRPEVERSILKRCAESVCRVAFLIGMGCINEPWFKGEIPLECVRFAELLVRASLNYIAPAITEGIKDHDSVSIKVEEKVVGLFQRLQEDRKRFAAAGAKVRNNALGLQVQMGYLTLHIKGSGQGLDRYATVKAEVEGLIEEGRLVEVKEGKTRWLSLIK